MSDMVIFISRGKKARFHAVGAFIPFLDDKGTERRTRSMERERAKERERERKAEKVKEGEKKDTKRCKNIKIMDSVFQGAVHT